MPWRERWTFVSWVNNSVGTQSCPTPPSRFAGRSDPTRPWYVRILDSTGLDVRDKASFKLIMSPDADLAGDLETTKSTSGLWIELHSADGKRCWPIAWRKHEGNTASSTCQAETISMAIALKSEALPLLELFREEMNRRVMRECRENTTKCISAVQTGYSAVSRHCPRTKRIALGVDSKSFASDDCHIAQALPALPALPAAEISRSRRSRCLRRPCRTR